MTRWGAFGEDTRWGAIGDDNAEEFSGRRKRGERSGMTKGVMQWAPPVFNNGEAADLYR